MSQLTTKDFFAKDNVKEKFKELLGKRSSSYLTTVVQISTQNAMLKKADPVSVYSAALTAATLDLPINPNLGFAYIVPYGKQAQFQMGYKGYIQLAQRSGLYKTISATEIYEGQLISKNKLSGFQFDFEVEHGEKVIGYAAQFTLLNGFEKTFYMSIEEVEAHAKKYSQTYKKGFGNWKDNFDAMATKTVLKLLISKYGPLSVEMQKAVELDQSVVTEDLEVDQYVDNQKEEPDFDSAFETVPEAEVVEEKPAE